jgi:hypothetical protein
MRDNLINVPIGASIKNPNYGSNTHPENTPFNVLHMKKAFLYSQTIKNILVLNWLLACSYIYVNILFLIPLAFIIMGYIGIYNYNALISFGYIMYQIIIIIGKTLLMIIFPTPIIIALSIILIFVNFYSLYLTLQFVDSLMSLKDDEIKILKSGWKPIVYTSIYL